MCAPGVQAGSLAPVGSASVSEITPFARMLRAVTTRSARRSENTVSMAVVGPPPDIPVCSPPGCSGYGHGATGQLAFLHQLILVHPLVEWKSFDVRRDQPAL